MSTIIRYILTRPLFFLLNQIISRFAFILITTLIIFSGLIISSYYKSGITVNFFGNSDSLEINGANENEVTTDIVTIKKGDTLGAILQKQPLSRQEIVAITKLANDKKISSSLKIGQQITFEYDISLVESSDADLNNENRTFKSMSIPLDKVRTLEFVVEDNEIVVKQIDVPLNKLVSKYEATIENSVISSLQKSGLSTNSIISLINILSYQIDFQRQIHAGDKISVITEKYTTNDGKLSHHGQILYASIITKKGSYEIYHYSPDGPNGHAQYFGSNGQSVKSTLLRTPVNVVRISGHYGYRKKHPVLGYGAMHKGVDFAAPTGTPIYAAGDGVVDFIGWKGGYGRFIVIKHNKNLSTAYAHSSRFASGLKKGSRVKQGEIISYVGASGRVTGAHLHFEVMVDGKQVNPMKFKSQPGVKLTGKKLEEFNNFKKRVTALGQELDHKSDLSEHDLVNISYTP